MGSFRLQFATDVYSIVEELKKVEKNGDSRNLRAAELLEKSIYIYLRNGEDYINLLSYLSDKFYERYSKWYSKNVMTPYMDNPSKNPVADQYSFSKYFGGLNKNSFEELQKMIIFLMDPRSSDTIDSMRGDEDSEYFGIETRNFVIPAYVIFVASLQGNKYLKEIEEAFNLHDLSEEDCKGFKKSMEDLTISGIAQDILKGKIN